MYILRNYAYLKSILNEINSCMASKESNVGVSEYCNKFFLSAEAHRTYADMCNFKEEKSEAGVAVKQICITPTKESIKALADITSSYEKSLIHYNEPLPGIPEDVRYLVDPMKFLPVEIMQYVSNVEDTIISGAKANGGKIASYIDLVKFINNGEQLILKLSNDYISAIDIRSSLQTLVYLIRTHSRTELSTIESVQNDILKAMNEFFSEALNDEFVKCSADSWLLLQVHILCTCRVPYSYLSYLLDVLSIWIKEDYISKKRILALKNAQEMIYDIMQFECDDMLWIKKSDTPIANMQGIVDSILYYRELRK